MNDRYNYSDPDWIDAFLLDELSESQKQLFEEALQNDPDLKEEVEHYKAVKKGVEASEKEALKKRLVKLEAGLPKATKRRMTWYGSRVAAAIILLLLPLYFILSNLNEVNSQELFADYFEPYPVLANGTVRGDAADDPLSEGIRAYQGGNYIMAITKLEAQSKDSKNGSFYLALSYMANDDASRAIPLLRDLTEDESFQLKEQATWYLGLAFLKNGEPDKARRVLQSLYKTSKDASLREKARTVLDEM